RRSELKRSAALRREYGDASRSEAPLRIKRSAALRREYGDASRSDASANSGLKRSAALRREYGDASRSDASANSELNEAPPCGASSAMRREATRARIPDSVADRLGASDASASRAGTTPAVFGGADHDQEWRGEGECWRDQRRVGSLQKSREAPKPKHRR